MKSKVLVLTAAAATALGSAAATNGAGSAVPVRVHAKLTSPATQATGTFQGVIRVRRRKTQLLWSLTYRRLSSQVTQAHIHSKSGGILVRLCTSCRFGVGGLQTITPRVARLLRSGTAWVHVHTRRNSGGEIRGTVLRGR